MKKLLLVALVLTVIFSVQAMAAKPTPGTMYGVDNTNGIVKRQPNSLRHATPKAITITPVDSTYNIRSIFSPSSNSIACTPGSAGNDTVQITYLVGANPYQLWHGYSLDGGSTWTR